MPSITVLTVLSILDPPVTYPRAQPRLAKGRRSRHGLLGAGNINFIAMRNCHHSRPIKSSTMMMITTKPKPPLGP